MKENEMEMKDARPWWSVRVTWLVVLAFLVCVLVALCTRPELMDRGFKLAGL